MKRLITSVLVASMLLSNTVYAEEIITDEIISDTIVEIVDEEIVSEEMIPAETISEDMDSEEIDSNDFSETIKEDIEEDINEDIEKDIEEDIITFNVDEDIEIVKSVSDELETKDMVEELVSEDSALKLDTEDLKVFESVDDIVEEGITEYFDLDDSSDYNGYISEDGAKSSLLEINHRSSVRTVLDEAKGTVTFEFHVVDAASLNTILEQGADKLSARLKKLNIKAKKVYFNYSDIDTPASEKDTLNFFYNSIDRNVKDIDSSISKDFTINIVFNLSDFPSKINDINDTVVITNEYSAPSMQLVSNAKDICSDMILGNIIELADHPIDSEYIKSKGEYGTIRYYNGKWYFQHNDGKTLGYYKPAVPNDFSTPIDMDKYGYKVLHPEKLRNYDSISRLGGFGNWYNDTRELTRNPVNKVLPQIYDNNKYYGYPNDIYLTYVDGYWIDDNGNVIQNTYNWINMASGYHIKDTDMPLWNLARELDMSKRMNEITSSNSNDKGFYNKKHNSPNPPSGYSRSGICLPFEWYCPYVCVDDVMEAGSNGYAKVGIPNGARFKYTASKHEPTDILEGNVSLYELTLRKPGEWIKDNNGWRYKNADGSFIKKCWAKIDGKKYHFDSKGYRQTGWLKLSNNWYYLNSKGIMKTGWITVKNKKYYLNSKGVRKTGWVKLKNKWYYFNSKGIMKTGWIKLKGKYYYLYKDGHMATNKWIGKYHVNEKGIRDKSRA